MYDNFMASFMNKYLWMECIDIGIGIDGETIVMLHVNIEPCVWYGTSCQVKVIVLRLFLSLSVAFVESLFVCVYE